MSQRKSAKSWRAALVKLIEALVSTGTLEFSRCSAGPRPSTPPGRSDTSARSYRPGCRPVQVIRASGSFSLTVNVYRNDFHSGPS